MRSQFFPTYNGLDPFGEFECTESGWSLPDDMKPIECKHISCPPLIDVSDDVEVNCLNRDPACVSLVPGKYYWHNDGGQKYRHCECNRALYRCKKEGQKIKILHQKNKGPFKLLQLGKIYFYDENTFYVMISLNYLTHKGPNKICSDV